MLKNGLEPWHLIVVLVVCFLLFGSQKLPDSARSLGQALRIFKAETKAMREEDDTSTPARARVDAARAPTAAPTLTAGQGLDPRATSMQDGVPRGPE
jgi:sec-independent protein translocase protein TatA